MENNFCPYCHARLYPDAKYCASCGKDVSSLTPLPEIHCAHCQKANPTFAVFCQFCGKPLKDQTTENTETKAEPVSVQQSDTPQYDAETKTYIITSVEQLRHLSSVRFVGKNDTEISDVSPAAAAEAKAIPEFFEETPAIEESPAMEETPSIEESPVMQETPVMEEMQPSPVASFEQSFQPLFPDEPVSVPQMMDIRESEYMISSSKDEAKDSHVSGHHFPFKNTKKNDNEEDEFYVPAHKPLSATPPKSFTSVNEGYAVVPSEESSPFYKELKCEDDSKEPAETSTIIIRVLTGIIIFMIFLLLFYIYLIKNPESGFYKMFSASDTETAVTTQITDNE